MADYLDYDNPWWPNESTYPNLRVQNRLLDKSVSRISHRSGGLEFVFYEGLNPVPNKEPDKAPGKKRDDSMTIEAQRQHQRIKEIEGFTLEYTPVQVDRSHVLLQDKFGALLKLTSGSIMFKAPSSMTICANQDLHIESRGRYQLVIGNDSNEYRIGNTRKLYGRQDVSQQSALLAIHNETFNYQIERLQALEESEDIECPVCNAPLLVDLYSVEVADIGFRGDGQLSDYLAADYTKAQVTRKYNTFTFTQAIRTSLEARMKELGCGSQGCEKGMVKSYIAGLKKAEELGKTHGKEIIEKIAEIELEAGQGGDTAYAYAGDVTVRTGLISSNMPCYYPTGYHLFPFKFVLPESTDEEGEPAGGGEGEGEGGGGGGEGGGGGGGGGGGDRVAGTVTKDSLDRLRRERLGGGSRFADGVDREGQLHNGRNKLEQAAVESLQSAADLRANAPAESLSASLDPMASRAGLIYSTEGNVQRMTYCEPPISGPGSYSLHVGQAMNITVGNKYDLTVNCKAYIKAAGIEIAATQGEAIFSSNNLLCLRAPNVIIDSNQGIHIRSDSTFVAGAFNVSGDSAFKGHITTDGSLSVPYLIMPSMSQTSSWSGTSKFINNTALWNPPQPRIRPNRCALIMQRQYDDKTGVDIIDYKVIEKVPTTGSAAFVTAVKQFVFDMNWKYRQKFDWFQTTMGILLFFKDIAYIVDLASSSLEPGITGVVSSGGLSTKSFCPALQALAHDKKVVGKYPELGRYRDGMADGYVVPGGVSYVTNYKHHHLRWGDGHDHESAMPLGSYSQSTWDWGFERTAGSPSATPHFIKGDGLPYGRGAKGLATAGGEDSFRADEEVELLII